MQGSTARHTNQRSLDGKCPNSQGHQLANLDGIRIREQDCPRSLLLAPDRLLASASPTTTVPIFNTLRLSYGLPEMPIEVNEYAWPTEQNPANAVYYLAQFERHNIRALRANWSGGSALHDYMANLVYRHDNGTYYPNGEWQLYKYYAGMTGMRVATNASSDLLFDVFATVSGNHLAKIIGGTRTVQAAYDIRVSGLSSLGLPTHGTVDVRSYRFDWAGLDGEIKAPVDLGWSKYTYSRIR